ncbi:PhzF family phenazine biosynthesis protein [Alkalicoccus halolimnae]|uniref:PhzF family phenazine biosynthesis protein n=1 Tax=Alkalicoccus halolimnae TaxID=1667239 RepID=A0AAJ8N2G4_9BACI|nr:PhzF family phenazine biosynthesis protein [Alkalicoccus halolimnae]
MNAIEGVNVVSSEPSPSPMRGFSTQNGRIEYSIFAPKAGIEEDPVTGSAHCTLVPYWKEKLNENEFTALQLSERGGKLFCTDSGETVQISGEAVSYLEGSINI